MPKWLVSWRPHADENKEERKTVRNAGNVKKENTKKKYEDAERETVRKRNAGRAKRQPERAKRRRRRRRRWADERRRTPLASRVDPAPSVIASVKRTEA